jgi:hypothetical protein
MLLQGSGRCRHSAAPCYHVLPTHSIRWTAELGAGGWGHTQPALQQGPCGSQGKLLQTSPAPHAAWNTALKRETACPAAPAHLSPALAGRQGQLLAILAPAVASDDSPGPLRLRLWRLLRLLLLCGAAAAAAAAVAVVIQCRPQLQQRVVLLPHQQPPLAAVLAPAVGRSGPRRKLAIRQQHIPGDPSSTECIS